MFTSVYFLHLNCRKKLTDKCFKVNTVVKVVFIEIFAELSLIKAISNSRVAAFYTTCNTLDEESPKEVYENNCKKQADKQDNVKLEKILDCPT